MQYTILRCFFQKGKEAGLIIFIHTLFFLWIKEFIERMRPKFPEAGEKLALRDDEEEGLLADSEFHCPTEDQPFIWGVGWIFTGNIEVYYP